MRLYDAAFGEVERTFNSPAKARPHLYFPASRCKIERFCADVLTQAPDKLREKLLSQYLDACLDAEPAYRKTPQRITQTRIRILLNAHGVAVDEIDSKRFNVPSYSERILSLLDTIPPELHYPLVMQMVLRQYAGHGGVLERKKNAFEWLKWFTERYGQYKLAISINSIDNEILAYAESCAQIAKMLPTLKSKVSFGERHGVVCKRGQNIEARLECPLFWRQQIRRTLRRTRETSYIAIVPTKLKIISEAGLAESLAMNKRHEKWLAGHVAVNSLTGKTHELPTHADISKQRYAALYRRGKALVDEAQQKDLRHILRADITLASRWHATRRYGKSRQVNPKFQGSSPKDAKQHFERLFEAFTTTLRRRKIGFSYMLAVEPHGDETPHFHCLFFTDNRAAFIELLQRYFYWRDPEPTDRAREHEYYRDVRVKIRAISNTDHALAYIGKTLGYVSKHSPAMQNNPKHQKRFNSETERAQAWRRTWNIRAIRFSVSGVTIYEHLRRLDEKQCPALAWPISVAKSGDMFTAVEMLNFFGIRAHYVERANRYGEKTRRFVGLIDGIGNVHAKIPYHIQRKKLPPQTETPQPQHTPPPAARAAGAKGASRKAMSKMSELLDVSKSTVPAAMDTVVTSTDLYIALLENGHIPRPPPK